MKELTQREFEQQIQRLIDGEIGRKKLAKELETDIRTLNKKIMEMSRTNPTLYASFIEKFPYRPKEIEVDIEELGIYSIIHGNSAAADNFSMSTRTITRKLKKLDKINPELYELYLRKSEIESSKIPQKDKEKYFINLARIVEEIEKRRQTENVEERNVEKKKHELEKTITDFEALLAQGMSKAEAARTLGYDGYPAIWKKYNELERIRTEEKYGKEGTHFRDSLKVDNSSLLPKSEQESEKREQKARDDMQK